MRVKKLIEELEKQPKNNSVYIINNEGYTFKDFNVTTRRKTTIIGEDQEYNLLED